MSFAIAFAGLFAHKEPLSSFDDIAGQLEATVPEAGQAVEKMPGFGESGTDSTIQLVAVGWSERLQRMAIAQAIYEQGKEVHFDGPEVIGAMVEPCDPAEANEALQLPYRDDGNFREDLLKLAAKQVKYGRAGWPELGFGGDLLVATIARPERQTSITIDCFGAI